MNGLGFFFRSSNIYGSCPWAFRHVPVRISDGFIVLFSPRYTAYVMTHGLVTMHRCTQVISAGGSELAPGVFSARKWGLQPLQRLCVNDLTGGLNE